MELVCWCEVSERTIQVRDAWSTLEVDRDTWTEDKVGRKVAVISTKYFRENSYG